MSALPAPIAGRECGECTACCIDLKIDDPELQKEDEVACPHLADHKGCTIYDRRPKTCRNWYCGWRLMKLSDAMRPDRCGVMLVPEMGTAPGYERGGLRFVFLGGVVPGILPDEMVDLAGKMVASNVPVFFTYGQGKYGKRVLANDFLKPTVRLGDREGFVRAMSATLSRLVEQVKADMAAGGT